VTLRIGSLFSGYGGLDMAVANHYGATTAWFVEFDKHPSAILAHHYPDVPNYGDVTAVDWSQVEPVDIITGGFPCQDVSTAGLRRGVHHGTRSGLWFEMAKAIDQLKPRKVVIENVAGLLSATAAGDVEPCPWCLGDTADSHMRALGAVLADLAEMGFDADWGSVRAADAGAPHGRLRVFIVATARHAGHDAGGTEQGQQPQGATGGPRQSGDDVAPDAARERGDGSGDAGPRRRAEPTDRSADDDGLTLLPTPTAQAAKHGSTPDVHANGYGSNLWDLPTLLPTPQARDHKDSYVDSAGCHRPGDTDSVPRAVRDMGADFGPYTAAIRRWEQVLGRPAPSPTEPGANGRPRLSPRFVEFMMGLPDGWVTGVDIPRSAQLKALGNGVVPQQAALALAMLDGDGAARILDGGDA
jgi:DNA (cytosine-5)-methyltransferase 1